MADTKISALTAATTPLAGTEVLPIVQSGVTKQVSVADLTAGRAVSALSLSLTNALTAANGGTGQSSYTIGDLLYASGATALSKLADVATGNALISGGVGVAPSWGKIGLTTHVSGTLGTANGGTGLTSFTANGVAYASSTSALATGTGLTFDGTTLQITSGGLNLGSGGVNGYISGGTWYGINSGNWVFQAGNASQAFRWNGSSGSVRMFLDTNSNLLLGTTSSPAGSGNFLINNGNVIQGTAAKGFNFTANSAAAGMTSQLLNYYEEGTYTIAFTMGSGSVTTNASNTTASYTRIGRMVFVSGNIEINAASTPSGTMSFQLPFTMANTSQNSERFAGVCRINGFTSGNGVGMVWADSGTTAYILDYTGANPVPDSSCELYFGFSYIAA
jgi:hypothetical protein